MMCQTMSHSAFLTKVHHDTYPHYVINCCENKQGLLALTTLQMLFKLFEQRITSLCIALLTYIIFSFAHIPSNIMKELTYFKLEICEFSKCNPAYLLILSAWPLYYIHHKNLVGNNYQCSYNMQHSSISIFHFTITSC